MRQRKLQVGAALVAVIAFSMFAYVTTTVGQQPGTNDNAAAEHAKSLSRAFRHASEVAIPTVVTIRTETKAQRVRGSRGENPFEGTPFEDLFEDQFKQFDFGMAPPQRGVGSGVIIDSSGIVLTNNHVVEGADEVTVRLADGREFTSTDIKTDSQTDLAVVRISGAGTLPEATLGDSDKMEIGDWVIAIGNPFDLEMTVSAGIISGKQRSLGATERATFLQTDAAINPGNSGGPLVNLDGEVVGINTAIASNSGGYQGIGFAIPSNDAKWVVSQLIESGSVKRAYLGVRIGEVSNALAEQFGVNAGDGVLVAEVVPDTPASEAGFEAGDIITHFAGRRVHSPRELQSVVERSEFGSKQRVGIVRDGKPRELAVVVKEMPNSFASVSAEPRRRAEESDVDSFTSDELGMTVSEMNAATAERLGYAGHAGVLVTDVDPQGIAADAGLREGMLIRQVDKSDVATLPEFEKAVDDASLEKGILLLIRTVRGEQLFIVLKST